jgi:hypothetical protein
MMDPPSTVDNAMLDLLQVLDWRSIELMLSDSLAQSLGCPHYIFAVKHPIQTFYDLICTDKRIVYLSHPISEPRRMEMAGRIDEARAFVAKMSQIIARLQADSTVIEPTTIDELRIRGSGGNLGTRWPFQPDERELLYEPPEPCPGAARPFVFPSGWESDDRPEIGESGLTRNLRNAIGQQIDARDHGLVEQSRIIACYRPLYEGNASGGVREELEHYGRLVSLNLRSAEASVVYSPSADHARYPRRRLAESIVPAWRRQRLLEGDDPAIEAFQERVLREDSELISKLLAGDSDALLRTIAECGLTIRPDEDTVPGGTLGAGDTVRRHAAAATLGEQVKRAANPYLDELAERGVIRVVPQEQMFYSALEADEPKENKP